MTTRRVVRIEVASATLGFAGVLLGIVASVGQTPVASPDASTPATPSAATVPACPSPSAAAMPAPTAPTATAVGSTPAPSLPAESPGVAAASPAVARSSPGAAGVTPGVTAAPAAQPCPPSGASPAASPPSAAATVTIRDFEFVPPSITVTAGSTVVWSNEGPSGHTVTADDGSFDSRNITPGATFEMTFETPGTYAYHCTPHPNMIGTVIVQ
jgi:plastocyanin